MFCSIEQFLLLSFGDNDSLNAELSLSEKWFEPVLGNARIKNDFYVILLLRQKKKA